MSILQLSLSNHTPTHTLSSSYSITGPTHLFLTHKFSLLTLTTPCRPAKSTIIRMGGGPRTFPGGVSKWQWKRMQAKKAKQLLKARLARERQIYEMRKRAELKAAVAELERPWEVVAKAPTLFSARADEHLKVLADRFQKPGGFDLWSEKDGPQLFETVDGLPSTRFFPKGVVHSVKSYARIARGDSNSISGFDSNRVLGDGGGDRNGYRRIGDNFGGDGELTAIGSGRVLDSGNGNMRSGRNGYKRTDGNLDGDGDLNSVSGAGVSEDGNGYGKMRGGRNWYRSIRDDLLDSDDELGELDLGFDSESGDSGKMGVKRNGYSKNSRNLRSGFVREGEDKGAINHSGNEDSYNGTSMRKVNGRRPGFRDSRSGSFNQEESRSKVNGRSSGFRDSRSGSFNQEESRIKVNGRRPGFRDSRSGSFNQEESGSKVNGRSSGFRDSRSGSFNQEESGIKVNGRRPGFRDSRSGSFNQEERGIKVNGRRPGFSDSRSGSFNQEESGIKVNGRRPGFRDSRSGGFNQKESGSNRAIHSSGGQFSRGKGSPKPKSSNSEVFDMSLQNDGSYGFSNRELEIPKSRRAEQ